ncbi:bifunctional shikimate kinase/3-dehydroquinate synthase [soil metagenome]
MTNFPPNKNIILTGFMGTGKSTVGRLLAAHLHRPFVDMDDQLVAHFGQSIATVFAEQGEAIFRAAEQQLCLKLAAQQGLVISTGGGALVAPTNRHALAQTGTLICLTATVAEIVRRIDSANDRPMLAGEQIDRQQRIRNLLYERRHAYAAIPHQVDTTGHTPEQIVQCVLDALNADAEVAGMTRIAVRGPSETYDICIGDNLLSQTGVLLRNRQVHAGPAAIVTNPMVGEHYAEMLAASLREAGFQPTICSVPEGEQHKTLATIANLYEQFLIAGLDRRSPVLALGGGVIGDMAGFAAATYLRGVPFVQIPTSLLAMVDASVGGKTGVDLPQGKNLVGAFKQPEVVIIDPTVIQTLPGAEFRSGLAEVIKHGIIGAPDLFQQLEAYGPTSMGHLVADAVRVKVQIVEEDPFERGQRALLNLGHTFGHAIELVSEFTMRHGEAVAVGLVAAAQMAVALGRCEPELAARITNLVEHLGLPTSVTGYDLDAVLFAMGHDKKRAGKTLRFVIPQALGDTVLIDDPGSEFVQNALMRVLK